jgi:DNA-binding GntR family transcriptional regulator
MTSSATKLTVKPVSVIAAVAASLRARVLNGELPPGTALPELELATQCGVARPTIRAAIQQLTLTGLLRREANRSAFVPRLSEAEILDLYSVRKLVETEVVRRIAESLIHPQAAEQAVRRLEWFAPDERWDHVVEADLAFHRGLVIATRSQRLLRLFELLEDEIRLSIAQLKPVYHTPSALAREHRDLLTVIESGQTARAVAMIEQHLDQARGDITGSKRSIQPRLHPRPNTAGTQRGKVRVGSRSRARSTP